MSLKVIAREGEFLMVRGTALLTFCRVRGHKVTVLVDGPGECVREAALRKGLPPHAYEQLIANIRRSSPKSRKCGSETR